MEPAEERARRDVGQRMAAAAAVFLDGLDGEQRTATTWAFPGDDERRRWFYTPTDHGGVVLGGLAPAQQRRALQLVAAGLSRPGFATAATIMGLENVLDELEGWRRGRHERRRDPGRYFLRVFGDPGSDAWAWRFGGHHISLNYLVLGGALTAATPCFLGARPAAAPLLGPHLLRPLAGAEDLGRELLAALDDAQRARAVISPVAPADIVSGNRRRVGDGEGPPPATELWRDPAEAGSPDRTRREGPGLGSAPPPAYADALRLTATPRGVPATGFTPVQRDLLVHLLDAYVGRLPDEVAEAERAKYAGAGRDALWFAWAGSRRPGEPHYYRLQAPRLLVEYDNAQDGADHVHTVWRDPENDFGGDVLGAHYRSAH